MSAANPRLVETGTSTGLAAWDFATLTPLSVSAEHSFDVFNDGAAAETATVVSLWAEVSNDGGATWDPADQAYVGRWLQLQAYDVDGTGIEAQTTPWTPVGLAARLYLKPIPADCRRLCKARMVMPAGFSSFTGMVRIVIGWFEYFAALSQGFHESGLSGVVTGTGDHGHFAVVAGGTIAASGTPDGNLQITDVTQWKYSGFPYTENPQALAIAASASGKARWITVSAGDAGINLTASSEVTAPAPITDRPAAPDNEPLLGWVHRTSGNIEIADVYPAALYDMFGLTLDGLDATLGPGRCIVRNILTRKDTSTPLGALADDTTNVIYMNVDGNPSVADFNVDWLPDGTEALWIVVVASGVITEVHDTRRLLGNIRVVQAYFAGLVAADQAYYWTFSRFPQLVARLPQFAQIAAGDIGDHTTGRLLVEIEREDGGWASIYDDDTYAPQLAFDATPPQAPDGGPNEIGFPPSDTLGYVRMRARIAELPTGGAIDPSDVSLTLVYEVYGA